MSKRTRTTKKPKTPRLVSRRAKPGPALNTAHDAPSATHWFDLADLERIEPKTPRLVSRRAKPGLLSTARHEAAHAVLAEILGHRVLWARLVKAGRYGLVMTDSMGCRDPLRHGIVALAGHAADMKWSRFGRWRRVSALDIEMYEDLGFRGGRSANTILNIARNLVDEYAPTINAVAKVLQKRDLTGDGIAAIMLDNGVCPGAES